MSETTLPHKGKVSYIPLSKVREAPAELALRKIVNREDPSFLNLRASVKQDGILNPPSVREIPDPQNPGDVLYCLVDGLQRTSAARDVGMTEIPVHILDVDQYRAFELMFIGNLQRVETRHADYAKGLRNLLALNPTMTKTELAVMLSQSLSWVEDRLKLTRLHESIQALVNDGVIKLTNAVALASLPEDRQLNFKDAAISKSAVDFSELVNAENQAIRKAAREGSKDVKPEFEARPKYKQMALIGNEAESLNEVQALLVQEGVSTPQETAKLVLKWCISLDPVSLAAGRKKFAEAQAEQVRDKAARAEERKKKKEEAEKNKPQTAPTKEVPSEFPTVNV